MKIKTKIAAICCALIGTLLLCSCHTVEGFGEDVQIGGKNIQKAATNNSDDSY